MSTVQAKVRRPLKVYIDGEKTQLLPGDPFPFDPEDRAHQRLWRNHAIELRAVEVEQKDDLDVDALVKAIQEVDGVGPATAKKIRKVIEDGDWR